MTTNDQFPVTNREQIIILENWIFGIDIYLFFDI
jgi:hypothetical protein